MPPDLTSLFLKAGGEVRLTTAGQKDEVQHVEFKRISKTLPPLKRLSVLGGADRAEGGAEQGWEFPASDPLPRTGHGQRRTTRTYGDQSPPEQNNVLKRLGSGWGAHVES